ncbi:LPXTG cell wall anchor domain-containing protein [Lacticaseibacillus absianus]|uniref:LPXTG cell wall anchor domain-containing protein n=1 Tax=Lacticaseibacillus absianus TaxID=2729623 RepID=UPI0015CE8F1E|nr:LPXTG cell wall anchor domain-containing protein [Lacticaseibacillus absianus]
MTKKLTLGYVLMAGAVLATLAGQPQAGVHASEQAPATATSADATPQASEASATATTSTVPAGQTVKTTGTTDTISPADADTTDYKNVGENAKVMVSQQYDDDGNKLDTYKATAVNRDAFIGDDAPDSNEGVTLLDAATIMDGDTTHYAEYVNGAWQVNGLTMNGGQKVAGRESFDVDVTAVLNGSEITHDFTLADGVKVQVGKTEHDQALNDKYGNTMVTGTYLTVSVYGENTFDDNWQGRVGEPDTIGQMGTGFVNVPFTFHYYTAAGELMTGTLNFVNGAKVTAPTDTDTDKGTTTPDPDTDKGTTTPDPDTDKGTTTPDPDTDKGTTTPDPDTDKGTTTPDPDTDKGTTTPDPDADKGTTTPAPKQDAPQPATDPKTPAKAPAPKTVTKAAATKTAKAIDQKAALPQTGEASSSMALLGLSLLALLGMGEVVRKRKA